jgi:hypothetical protein
MVNKQLYHKVLARLKGCCAQDETSIVGNPAVDVAPPRIAESRVAPYPQLPGKTSDIHLSRNFLIN